MTEYTESERDVFSVGDDRYLPDQSARLLAEAKAAMRAREEILAIVSHDLRSPLAAIGDALQLLSREIVRLEPQDGDRLRKYLDAIARSAGSMTRLASDLLDFASIDAGRLSVHPEPHSMWEAIREIRERFDAQARRKKVRLCAEVEAGLPVIRYDKDRVLQVLGNLVSNALRFTMPGDSVRIRAGFSNQTIVTSVHDTGAGMAPDTLKHIFDRHWQACHRAAAGHGLGIAISKSIIEAHGGAMFAESKLGEGTTVSFSLPVLMPGVASTRANQGESARAALAGVG